MRLSNTPIDFLRLSALIKVNSLRCLSPKNINLTFLRHMAARLL
jgi:hypothetical protein